MCICFGRASNLLLYNNFALRSLRGESNLSLDSDLSNYPPTCRVSIWGRACARGVHHLSEACSINTFSFRFSLFQLWVLLIYYGWNKNATYQTCFVRFPFKSTGLHLPTCIHSPSMKMDRRAFNRFIWLSPHRNKLHLAFLTLATCCHEGSKPPSQVSSLKKVLDILRLDNQFMHSSLEEKAP